MLPDLSSTHSRRSGGRAAAAAASAGDASGAVTESTTSTRCAVSSSSERSATAPTEPRVEGSTAMMDWGEGEKRKQGCMFKFSSRREM
jgi:hypothetical protein